MGVPEESRAHNSHILPCRLRSRISGWPDSTKSGADHAETRNGATASIALQRDLADPPHTGEETDENTRVTPAVVTNPNLEVKLYGPDAKVIRAATHEQRTDLWNGMTTSPSAVTVRDRRNFLDLTEAARLRWIVRTNAIHTLHPVVKLADGRLIVGDRQITTHGEFLSVEIAFTGMRWYTLDPEKVVVRTEVVNPNLRMVDEVGLAMLIPGGGHGIAGSANLSNVELFAYPMPR